MILTQLMPVHTTRDGVPNAYRRRRVPVTGRAPALLICAALEHLICLNRLGVRTPETLELFMLTARHARINLSSPNHVGHIVDGEYESGINAPGRSRSRVLGTVAMPLLDEHEFSRLRLCLLLAITLSLQSWDKRASIKPSTVQYGGGEAAKRIVNFLVG